MIALNRGLRPLAFVASHLFALWMRTLRVHFSMPDGSTRSAADYPMNGVIFALSERDLLATIPAVDHRDCHVLVAEGSDGDWAVAMTSRFGLHFVRGSSLTHGARALRSLNAALRNNEHPAAIFVDGPLGPAGSVKEGVVACAANTGRKIVPVAAAAHPCIVFRRSWAAHYLPLPFARVVIATADPISVVATASRSDYAIMSSAIAATLGRLRQLALQEVERKSVHPREVRAS
jgi:lysophospholipid acyltransferase (LPLAT)-like uncharacterized protein